MIVEALDALPDDLGDDLVVKAEAYLVEQAAVFGPRELRHLGRGVLEHLAPEIADEAEYQRLLAEETRAQAATQAATSDPVVTGRPTSTPASPTTSRTGCGPTWTPTPPHAAPHSARSTLCRSPADVARRSWRSWRTSPTPGCPTHGGTTTSVMVTLDLDTLLTGLGTATTSTGDRITAEQARRLACQARIIPVVLGRQG